MSTSSLLPLPVSSSEVHVPLARRPSTSLGLPSIGQSSAPFSPFMLSPSFVNPFLLPSSLPYSAPSGWSGPLPPSMFLVSSFTPLPVPLGQSCLHPLPTGFSVATASASSTPVALGEPHGVKRKVPCEPLSPTLSSASEATSVSGRSVPLKLSPTPAHSHSEHSVARALASIHMPSMAFTPLPVAMAARTMVPPSITNMGTPVPAPPDASPSRAVPSNTTSSSHSLPLNVRRSRFSITKFPIRIFQVQIPLSFRRLQTSATTLADSARTFTPADSALPHMLLPVRIMGSRCDFNSLFAVAGDVCRLLNIRKENTSKALRSFHDGEKGSMQVICTTTAGISSTRALSVLSFSGIQKLCENAVSPLGAPVLHWIRNEFLRLVTEKEKEKEKRKDKVKGVGTDGDDVADDAHSEDGVVDDDPNKSGKSDTDDETSASTAIENASAPSGSIMSSASTAFINILSLNEVAITRHVRIVVDPAATQLATRMKIISASAPSCLN